jgi:hypothetical protein
VLAYHVDRFPYEDPVTGQEHAGLLLVDLETGAAETLWHGKTAHPRPVRLFDQPHTLLVAADNRLQRTSRNPSYAHQRVWLAPTVAPRQHFTGW